MVRVALHFMMMVIVVAVIVLGVGGTERSLRRRLTATTTPAVRPALILTCPSIVIIARLGSIRRVARCCTEGAELKSGGGPGDTVAFPCGGGCNFHVRAAHRAA